jgi:hypothetical protein
VGHVGPFPTKIVTRFEVPTRVAILHKSARHSRHKALDDLLCIREDLKLG